MRLWPRRRGEPQALVSISDPAAAALFSLGPQNLSGIALGESGALGLSAMWRAMSLLSGTMGQLPLKTYQDVAGERKPSKSVFDQPGGADGPTAFEWKRQLIIYLKLHGNIYLWENRNAAGAVDSYTPLHPLACRPSWPTREDYASNKLPLGGLWFTLTLENGDKVTTDAKDILHIPGMSLDGRIGLSLVQYAGQSLGTAAAGDRSAARTFSNGASISGIISPEAEVDGFDAKGIRRDLDNQATGYENAGGIAIINRVLKFTPWTMTLKDAQFLESRQFSIEEISRWTGVPPHLLMQTEKQTSWGTGVDEQNRALGRTVLGPDCNLIEERCSRRLKPSTRFVEFDFAALERPSPDREIELLIAQWNADQLTLNECRRIRNMEPIPGGDVVKTVWEAQNVQPAAA